MSRLARIVIAVILCGLMSLATHSHAHATTLTPPPPPGATCQTTGTDTFCHGVVTFSATNIDTGISCGTFEVLFSAVGTLTYELRYNASSLAEQVFHVNSTGVFINSVSGKTITSNGHFTAINVFGTPGDFTTVTSTQTGALNISTGQSFGLVTKDAGRVVFDPNGSILFQAGQLDQITNFPGFVQAICAALS